MEYLCCDKFMVRVPSLPLETFWKFNNFKFPMYEYINQNDNINSFVKESILLSSETLYDSLINFPSTKKKIKNLNDGLLKYMIRMSTRPTPFGLFSGVALGEFSDKTKIIVNQNSCIKDVRVDTYWLNHIIHDLEKDINIVSNLNVKFNSICYVSGDRLKNPYFSNHGDIEKMGDSIGKNNILYTDLIKLIKENTRNFISYNGLKEVIKNVYQGVPEDVIDYTLMQLIENEYLMTDLRIPAYCDDTLKHVIDVLKTSKCTSEHLICMEELYDLLKKYLITDDKLSALKNIYFYMKNIYKTKNYLEVNKGLCLSENYLDNNIKNRLQNFINDFSLLSVESSEYSVLNKFKGAFSEEYGLNVEVPLTEVIDSNGFNGLELIENEYQISDREAMIKRIIDNKIMLSIMNGKEEVKLSIDDFKNIPARKENHRSCKSCDMVFNIINQKCNSDSDYKLILGCNAGTSKAGKMFQRFYNVFDNNLINEYNEIYSKEIELTNDDYIIVEAREAATMGRINNVINRYRNHEYYLALSCVNKDDGKEILMDDLCIGLDQDRNLYIKCVSKNKKCKIIKDNVLNTNLNSKILGLLEAISYGYEDSIVKRVSYLYKNKYVYIPRIIFDEVILSLKSWNFNDNDFNLSNYEDFKKSFYQIKKDYNIDNYIYFYEGDNKLLLDLNKEQHVEIIYKAIKKNRILNLSETFIRNPDELIVEDLNKEKYISEFVFSFIQKQNSDKGSELSNFKENLVYKNLALQNKNNRFRLYCDGWVYIKLYGMGDRTNELLTQKLPKLIDNLEISKFFFLRYRDEKNHLRLRLKFKDEQSAISQMHILNSWLNDIEDKCLINKTVFDVYEREINRYGGINLIENAEEIFNADSKFAIALLNLFDLDDPKQKDLVYIVGMVAMLKNLTGNINDIFEIMDEINLQLNYRKEYKEHKEYFTQIVKCVLQDKIQELDEKFLQVIDIYNERNKTISDFRKSLEIEVSNQNTTNSKKEIIFSLVHMYCNRMTGILEYEGKYLSIIRHVIYALVESNKYISKISQS